MRWGEETWNNCVMYSLSLKRWEEIVNITMEFVGGWWYWLISLDEQITKSQFESHAQHFFMFPLFLLLFFFLLELQSKGNERIQFHSIIYFNFFFFPRVYSLFFFPLSRRGVSYHGKTDLFEIETYFTNVTIFSKRKYFRLLCVYSSPQAKLNIAFLKASINIKTI